MNKKIKILICTIILLVLLSIFIVNFKQEEKRKIKAKEEQEYIDKINSYYNNYVISQEELNIYNDKQEIVGKIGKNVEIILDDTLIDKNTKYFKLKEFENSYIEYDKIEKIDSLKEYNKRYKKYIVFNENIITNNKTSYYDEFDNLVYEFNNSYSLPIIIKEDNKYGVEFNDRLLYVKNEDILEIKYNLNTQENNSSGVAVLNYHAFYDENNFEESSKCTTSICHSISQFKSQLEYIKENNILTLRTDELEKYIDGKINLPKSVLITIDDGPKTEHAVDILTEYQMYATIFLITSWFDIDKYYKTDYIELHSHTNDLHDGGNCPGGQGSAIKCLNRELLLSDLKTSREKLNETTVFCYPFYEYNNYAINIVKEAGFKMAFTGEIGDMLVHVNSNKLILPRFVITTSTTLNDIDEYFKKIN